MQQSPKQLRRSILRSSQKKAPFPKQQTMVSQEDATVKKLSQKDATLLSTMKVDCSQLVAWKKCSYDSDYQLSGELGEGSFGKVYKVTHKKLKLQRAMKAIKKQSNTPFSNFNQIDILKQLDHPNILKIYEFYQAGQYYYIICQLFEGRQLFEQITLQQKLTQKNAALIMLEILKAVHYTHSLGIMHRDMKPQNILVQNVQGKFKVKIIDWGLSQLVENKNQVRRICGTPAYCAPEMLIGKHSLCGDMWAIGVIAYVMLTGQMPFWGKNTEDTIRIVKKGVLNVRQPSFKKLTAAAQNFVGSLIQQNPTKRATAAQAIQHQWIRAHEIINQPHYLQQTLQRLRQFRATHTFGTAVISFINNHLSSSSQRDKLQTIFSFLDSNKDGVLSLQQLSIGYEKIYGKIVGKKIAEQTFMKLDINHNGLLQFSEFLTFGMQRQREQDKQRLAQAFKLFDYDGDGKISCVEISRVLQGNLSEVEGEEIEEIVRGVSEKEGIKEIDFDGFVRCVEKIYQRTVNRLEKKGSQDDKKRRSPKKDNKKSDKKSEVGSQMTKSKLKQRQKIKQEKNDGTNTTSPLRRSKRDTLTIGSSKII